MPRQPNVLHKDKDRAEQRRPSFGRKSSFSASSQSSSKEGTKRRGSTSSTPGKGAGNGFYSGLQVATTTDKNSAPPPLPSDFNFALAAAAKLSRETDAIQTPASADSFSRMLSRTGNPTPAVQNGYSAAITAGHQLAPPAVVVGQQSELSMMHQHMMETANKRISTLDYLRKAHEGRVYWFNTLLFDKPDLARMPYFDSRKLARRATNYLLLGLSLPTVIDLNSNNPTEFLRSLNTLLTEFDSFQALHSENGSSSSSLSRARIPQMFRRATAPSSKGRRSSNANNNVVSSVSSSSTSLLPGGGPPPGGGSEIGYPLEQTESNGAGGGVSSISLTASGTGGTGVGGGGGGGGGGGADVPASVMHFAASEQTDLLPGEEYTHLLTPSLPFDPDFFETFATLCDVLIDTYTRLLSLVPTPRECTAGVAEMFAKADSRVRKIIIQGVIKEFEETSRQGVKGEVANIGKVVLGGLM
ncbi:hypothetical protein B0H66DRAFT_637690 [Apodospora peruviana]|uniref:Uncharacterized protein n=1 Tax=Apodospora peruviana TaxID=516989 RepID=A0AAE0MCX4_9PEZI|nr:hypothetical protein B0H66DRAFT_637690 [Apodospora peruviana]